LTAIERNTADAFGLGVGEARSGFNLCATSAENGRAAIIVSAQSQRAGRIRGLERRSIDQGIDAGIGM
jgi:hypothetical protein